MAYIVKKDFLLGTKLNFFLMNIEHLILWEGMVGDTGFEPVTSTVCRLDVKKRGKNKQAKSPLKR